MEPKKYACACVWPWVCMVSRGCYVAWKENGLILCSALVVVVMYGKVMKFMKVVGWLGWPNMGGVVCQRVNKFYLV